MVTSSLRNDDDEEEEEEDVVWEGHRPHPRSDEGCSPANICRIVEQMNYGTARDSFTAHHPLVWPPPKAPTVSLHNHFLLFSNGLGGIAGVICSVKKKKSLLQQLIFTVAETLFILMVWDLQCSVLMIRIFVILYEFYGFRNVQRCCNFELY
ncbi:hypothetical protein CEXT_442631 [Caerostris extrusa]|uniref:Uncharacterized protein n=1 Tax=Caerostris extrusa TaxID=172846 RepID=A0AAV4PFQ8_CAEEX|nr:hypothetical protein CEXT_442631 [Caerostris extrusa]